VAQHLDDRPAPEGSLFLEPDVPALTGDGVEGPHHARPSGPSVGGVGCEHGPDECLVADGERLAVAGCAASSKERCGVAALLIGGIDKGR